MASCSQRDASCRSATICSRFGGARVFAAALGIQRKIAARLRAEFRGRPSQSLGAPECARSGSPRRAKILKAEEV